MSQVRVYHDGRDELDQLVHLQRQEQKCKIQCSGSRFDFRFVVAFSFLFVLQLDVLIKARHGKPSRMTQIAVGGRVVVDHSIASEAS